MTHRETPHTLTGYANGVNEYVKVCVCACFPVKHLCPIPHIFPPHVQCSQDRLPIPCDPEEDEAFTEDE